MYLMDIIKDIIVNFYLQRLAIQEMIWTASCETVLEITQKINLKYLAHVANSFFKIDVYIGIASTHTNTRKDTILNIVFVG